MWFGNMRFHACVDITWLVDFAKEPTIPLYTNTLDLQGLVRLDNSRLRLRTKEIQLRVAALIRRSPYMALNGVNRDFWLV